MIYEYNEEVVNLSNNFNDKNNFVGYILPNGSIFRCENHNISNIDTFLKMYLELLDANYNTKDELLNIDVDNRLAKIILNYLKKASHQQIHALIEFEKTNQLSISDILVGVFGCHLVTRLKKEIITSETNHRCFYNYLLHDFTITTIDKIVYDDEQEKYQFVTPIDRNDYLYDEIKRIKEEVSDEELDLFHKTI